jgi:menaquinol-cytochrome c reductase iron-sulfur subunit
MSQPAPGEGETTRRDAVMGALSAIAGFIGAALAIPLAAFLFGPAVRGTGWGGVLGKSIPPTPRSRDEWVKVGELSALPEGQPVLTTVPVPVQEAWSQMITPVAVYVQRTGPDNARIYDVHCTHMGCPVTWNQAAARFLCPCHGGVFDGNGRPLSGPPPRGLDQYAVKVGAGILYMGTLQLPGA